MKVINWLKGKKTYVLGLAVVAYGLYNHFWGANVPWAETIEQIFDGSLIMTVRAALGKIGLNA